MNSMPWFERTMKFGHPIEMLPFFLERLSGTFVRLQSKAQGIQNDILSTPSNGKWSVKQIIGHLTEVDRVVNKRLDEICSGQEMMSPAVFEPQDYNPWPIEKVLMTFQTQRLINIAKYNALSPEMLLHSSMHPRLKVKMTPVDLAWFDAEHDDHHLVKINEIIFTLTKN